MDLNDSSSKQSIHENLEEAALPSIIPQQPKFSGYHPSKVLNFLSELKSDSKIHQEIRINLFLADVFDAEYAFLVHEQTQKNRYKLKTIGDMRLQKDIKFILRFESSPNPDIGEEIAKNSVFRNGILDVIQKPIENLKVFNKVIEKNKKTYPFLLVLLNKNLILDKNDLTTKAKEQSPQPIPAEISLEDTVLIRDWMRLLSPIFNILLHLKVSHLLKWVPDISKRMIIQFNEQSAWLTHIRSLFKETLRENRIRFYLSEEEIEKFFEENPTAKKEFTDGTIPMVIIGVRMGSYRRRLIKDTFYLPIKVAGELLGVFEIRRPELSIHIDRRIRAQYLVVVCSFSMMLQHLDNNI